MASFTTLPPSSTADGNKQRFRWDMFTRHCWRLLFGYGTLLKSVTSSNGGGGDGNDDDDDSNASLWKPTTYKHERRQCKKWIRQVNIQLRNCHLRGDANNAGFYLTNSLTFPTLLSIPFAHSTSKQYLLYRSYIYSTTSSKCCLSPFSKFKWHDMLFVVLS